MGNRKTEAGYPQACGSPSQGRGIFRATERKISLTDSPWSQKYIYNGGMKHYVCTGGCKGVSDKPGNCGAPTCAKHGKPLTECDCVDGKHARVLGDSTEKVNPERGAAGIIIIAVVGLVLFGGGYVLVKKWSSSDTPSTKAQAAAEQEVITVAPAPAASNQSRFPGFAVMNIPRVTQLTRVDASVSKTKDSVYVMTNSGYFKIATPDPESFERLYASASSETPAPHSTAAANPSSASQNTVTYYKDSKNVYVLEQPASSASEGTAAPALAVLLGADPATFVILSAEYAKDAQHVYLIITVCNEGVCTQALKVIEGADLATFKAYEESIIQPPGSTETILIDAADVNNLYYVGDVIASASAAANATLQKKRYGTPELNGLIWYAP